MTDGLLAGPIRIFRAPEGTAEPLPPSNSPPSPWQLMGGGLYDNQGLEGIYEEDWNDVQSLAQTFPEDVFREREAIEYALRHFDCRLEALQILFGNNPITEVARTRTAPGYRQMNLMRGQQVDKYAALIVGMSPYAEHAATGQMGLNLWHPRVAFRGPGLMRFRLANQTIPEVRIKILLHSALGVGGLTEAYEPANTMPMLTGTDQAGTVGQSFSYMPMRTDGNAPFTFSATGLPSWATLDANTGRIFGTPDAAAMSTVDMTVTDDDGDTDTASFTITIVDA